MGRPAWLFVALLVGCSRSASDWVTPDPPAEATAPSIMITGVVRHFEVEGGFFAIRGEDSVTYDPTNLPVGFQKEGLPVEAAARRRGDMVSTRQVGPIVELERIRAR
jgi:hypothetical protein